MVKRLLSILSPPPPLCLSGSRDGSFCKDKRSLVKQHDSLILSKCVCVCVCERERVYVCEMVDCRKGIEGGFVGEKWPVPVVVSMETPQKRAHRPLLDSPPSEARGASPHHGEVKGFVVF